MVYSYRMQFILVSTIGLSLEVVYFYDDHWVEYITIDSNGVSLSQQTLDKLIDACPKYKLAMNIPSALLFFLVIQ